MANIRSLLLWVAHLKCAIKSKDMSERGMDELEHTLMSVCSNIHEGNYGHRRYTDDRADVIK